MYPITTTMSSLAESLVAYDGERIITEVRLSDGYVNATKLCQSAGSKKQWKNWWRTQTAKSFVAELATVNSMKNGTRKDELWDCICSACVSSALVMSSSAQMSRDIFPSQFCNSSLQDVQRPYLVSAHLVS